jgi:HEPN domain-containing protein
MSPAEDARLLLAIVQRHLRSLRFSLDPAYPEEDWGFTAQQAVEKLLKAWIVLMDRQPPRVHDLADLADLAQETLPPELLELQVFAVEARYAEGPFALPASRPHLVNLLERELQRCQQAVAAAQERDARTGT